MKRLLVAFLALTLLVLGAGIATAQIENNAVITPTNKVYAAWQPFEGGVMIWWSDLDQIWVLINPVGNTPGQAYIYQDNWTNQGISAGSPPLGRYGAVRGFGYIWANYLSGGAGQLGWAYAPEIGYDSAARTVSGNGYRIQGPGETEYFVSFIPVPNTTNLYFGVGGAYSVIDIG
jgi:hypothetical protein